ncbi:hypothetical protein T459_00880 [Capsicum annuum]|uniref:Pentatricopeptide repeat-containing protein-mitochondrial domain-containing protein n=1 Tax=Capsicum annuum TaxID=4072 RepID=A0A2G3AFN8_CAPAN|nr:hypothetical protein T459_00880 [Capsicum annuum]
MKRMGLCVPNSFTYNCLLDAISKGGDVGLTKLRLKEMCSYGWELDKYAYMPVLQCYCNAGKFENALVLVERIEDLNISLNEKTCFVLTHGFVRESRTDKAVQLLDKMKKMGFVMDTFDYGVLIEEFSRDKEIEKAIQLYEDMNVSGIHPDIKILSDLISCARDERDMIRIVEGRYESLDRKAWMLLYNSTLACPNTVSFGLVIDGLCPADWLEMALSLFRDMDHIGWKRSVLLYNNLVDSLSRSGRLDECYELLNEIKQSEFLLTHYTCNSIFGCLCRQGYDAGTLLLGICARGYCPDVVAYNIIINGLCKDKRALETQDFLDEMMDKGLTPSAVTYSSLIDGGLCKCGKPDDTLIYLHEMERKDMKPDPSIYIVLIDAFIKSLNPNKAYYLLKEVVHNESLQDLNSKIRPILKEAILSLSADPRTSSNVKILLEEDHLTTLCNYCEVG